MQAEGGSWDGGSFVGSVEGVRKDGDTLIENELLRRRRSKSEAQDKVLPRAGSLLQASKKIPALPLIRAQLRPLVILRQIIQLILQHTLHPVGPKIKIVFEERFTF